MRIHNTALELILKPFLPQEIAFKPKGLWYGIDGAWTDWCKSEELDWVYSYNYNLELDLSKILILQSDQDIMNFHRTFSRPVDSHMLNIKYPDWKIIAEEYAGVEINPYNWDFRLRPDFIWYYSWDCASGCVWDKKAIISINKVCKKSN